MDTATRVQILDEADSIYTLWKGINSITFSPPMDK